MHTALPESVAVPKLLGTYDDGDWVVLLFEHIDGVMPAQPWKAPELERACAAAGSLAAVAKPGLARDHPRLGGWEYVTPQAVSRYSRWAADCLGYLAELEKTGLLAAQGQALVHFDFYAHNLLLTPDQVVIVDWPHARQGAPFADLVMLLASAACDGIDPEPFLHRHADPALPAATVDAFLAAHTGFLLGGAFSAVGAGYAAIAQAKLHLGLGALRWLESRLGAL